MTNKKPPSDKKSKSRTRSLDARKVSAGESANTKLSKAKRVISAKNTTSAFDCDSGADASLSSSSEVSGISPDSLGEMTNICSNSDKHLISCEHHERFHKQFHSEALCCKCRPRLE